LTACRRMRCLCRWSLCRWRSRPVSRPSQLSTRTLDSLNSLHPSASAFCCSLSLFLSFFLSRSLSLSCSLTLSLSLSLSLVVPSEGCRGKRNGRACQVVHANCCPMHRALPPISPAMCVHVCACVCVRERPPTERDVHTMSKRAQEREAERGTEVCECNAWLRG